jgi:hypothetical protein
VSAVSIMSSVAFLGIMVSRRRRRIRESLTRD